MRRRLETIETVTLVAATTAPAAAHELLNTLDGLTPDPRRSGPFAWRGTATASGVKVEVLLVAPAEFTNQLLLTSAADAHLTGALADEPQPGQPASLRQWLKREQFATEAGALRARRPAVRGARAARRPLASCRWPAKTSCPSCWKTPTCAARCTTTAPTPTAPTACAKWPPSCATKATSTSASATIRRPPTTPTACRVERVRQQHQEIDQLNQELAPFRIFKGIESDILSDGSLDYPPTVLETFDFIVASVHSNLKMDERKATTRVLRAIENPYTTMLGHPTGRLLLRREGYPLDHKAVIDACAKHNVIIEINANPWRLDLDWRWVHYALEQGVQLSINPDAHHTNGYADMRYGVLMGRKGGLTKAMTFNAKSVEEAAEYFARRKASIKPPLEFQDSLFG